MRLNYLKNKLKTVILLKEKFLNGDIMEFKAAIFDLDGTLVDSLMLWEVLWSGFGERFLGDKNFTPSAEDDKAVRTLVLADAMELIHKNYSIANSGEELLEMANAIMRDFYSNDVKLKNGVKEFLEYCLNKGIKMCIASATAPELLKLAIKSCKLEKYFLKIFSCADYGVGKEKPDIFIIARDFLGTPNEETCVFEDSVVAIETASKIGMKTVGIYDKYNFGQERIKQIANEYIANGESLTKFIK